MRISMFSSDAHTMDRDGLTDKRGRGGYYGSHQGSSQQQQSDDEEAKDDNPTIGDLLGATLSQYQGSGAFELSM